jgi:inositol 1,4,5-triphosphate receptor type 1
LHYYCPVGIDKHEYDKRNPWKLLKDNTHSIEVNYITKDGKEILTQVYFPFDKERELTDDDKHKLQMDINRDGPEDKVRDLLEWTESVSKRDKLQTYLKEHQFLRLLLGGETIRHWILVFLTILLNVFVIAFFKIPQFNNCQGTENVTAIEPLLILPNPVDCWTHYQFILLYLFGIPHLFFSLWMIVAFFVKQSPNLSFSIPFIHRKLYHWKYNSSRFNRMCSSKFIDFIEEPQDSQCFDLKIYDPFLIYRIFFVLCSFAGLATFGYFYCFCILYIFIYVDVFNSVIVAITGRGMQYMYDCFYTVHLIFYS